MAGRLLGKVAIVTGGSLGVGKGIAKIFAKEGAKVAICSRKKDDLDKTVTEIKESGGEIIGLICDVVDSSQVQNLIKETVKTFGKLNILVNNAGINPRRPFTIEDTTEEEWEEFISINAKGTFLASKYAIPEIRKASGGSIIMISSISAHRGQNNTGCYNASKAAQEGMVKNMALDLAKDKIRVNAICPGWIMVENLREAREKIIDYINELHPIGRIGTPEDIAWAAVYLASDESTWVTGASFAIDGGYRAR
ncbi:MAG: SDR family NAD(P)-dependent oxidoreductase [Candidatus Humimicrobiaceae bacterium]